MEPFVLDRQISYVGRAAKLLATCTSSALCRVHLVQGGLRSHVAWLDTRNGHCRPAHQVKALRCLHKCSSPGAPGGATEQEPVRCMKTY
jgi:hypothetical protein